MSHLATWLRFIGLALMIHGAGQLITEHWAPFSLGVILGVAICYELWRATQVGAKEPG